MVYLNLSVNDIDEAVEFYEDKLGIFKAQNSSRLICKLRTQLILDLKACNTEEHIYHFGQNSHTLSSFQIHIGDSFGESEVSIFERLNRYSVVFDRVENLGGDCLSFVDPSGNKLVLHAHLGVFK